MRQIGSHASRIGFPLRLAAAAALAGLAAACSPADRIVTGSTVPVDYRERHPIVLKQSARTLDVFAGRGTGTIDSRQIADIRGFAAEYASRGRGGIFVQVPHGHQDQPYARHALSTINRILAQSSAGGTVSVTSYQPTVPDLAAPIRLTFSTLEAKVESRCGLWPDDLGPGPGISDSRNRPYHNLGCSTQQNLAAQIADPLDLVRPRQEGRIDTVKRNRAIETLRKGEDPSTQYRDEANKISQTVGAN